MPTHLKDVLPQAQAFAHKQDQALRLGRVPLEKLLVSQKLSRELTEYSLPSPAARAVWQMQAAGRVVRPGQRVRLLFTLGKPGVQAWDVPERPDPRRSTCRATATCCGGPSAPSWTRSSRASAVENVPKVWAGRVISLRRPSPMAGCRWGRSRSGRKGN